MNTEMLNKTKTGELTDDELGQVSGGGALYDQVYDAVKTSSPLVGWAMQTAENIVGGYQAIKKLV